MVEKSNNLKSKTQSHNSSITDHSQIHQSHCYSQDRIIRLEEKVKTLFIEHNKLNDTLTLINTTQTELLKQITALNSIINTLKWTLTITVAIFAGLFVFIMTEIIKLIH